MIGPRYREPLGWGYNLRHSGDRVADTSEVFMAIFEVKQNGMTRLTRTSLAAESIQERRDLQRLLRVQISEILPDVLIISEEFGEWDDSRRRIDLLGLDRRANLVVIELKRGDT